MGREVTKKEKPEACPLPVPSDSYSTYHIAAGTKPGACVWARLLVKTGPDNSI